MQVRCGVVPTMVTPFTASGEIDLEVVDQLVEWFVQQQCAGIFTNCLSSEMFHLSAAERVTLTQRVHTAAAGRVPVFSCGTFADTVQDQAREVVEMAKHCDAVVVITSKVVCEDEPDTVLRQRLEELLHLTGNTPLGLYECPVPYKRLVSPDLLAWASTTNRFVVHKDTSCSEPAIQAKLAALAAVCPGGDPRGAVEVEGPDAVRPLPCPLKFFNANVETLRFSLRHGAHGFCGISANFYPALHVRVCGLSWQARSREQEAAVQHAQAVMTVGECVVVQRYPACAKRFLREHCGIGGLRAKCRVDAGGGNEGDEAWGEQALLRLRCLHELTTHAIANLGA